MWLSGRTPLASVPSTGGGGGETVLIGLGEKVGMGEPTGKPLQSSEFGPSPWAKVWLGVQLRRSPAGGLWLVFCPLPTSTQLFAEGVLSMVALKYLTSRSILAPVGGLGDPMLLPGDPFTMVQWAGSPQRGAPDRAAAVDQLFWVVPLTSRSTALVQTGPKSTHLALPPF